MIEQPEARARVIEQYPADIIEGVGSWSDELLTRLHEKLRGLTRALNVDFSTLLDAESDSAAPIREHLRADHVPVIDDKRAGCVRR